MSERLRAVVVTGMSGSGKSTALHVLEDLGFYCIDNLPVTLLPRFLELWESSGEEVRRVALGIDVRAGRFLRDFPRVFDELRTAGITLEVLYFEASDDVLVRRFSETRRPHPAAEGGSVADGIRREREALQGLREVADRIVDTSAFTVHELRATLRDLVERPEAGAMTVSLVSFGYKYGLPSDADIALDCRFLPNPFFVEELRPKIGTDPAVAEYVLARDDTRSSCARSRPCSRSRCRAISARARATSRSRVGCTGGRHRSVVLVEELRRRLAGAGHRVLVRHRDAER